MIKKTLSMTTMVVLLFMFSCEDRIQNQHVPRLEDLKQKVRDAGYSTEGMREFRGGYLIEGDLLMSEETINNLKPASKQNGRASHYVISNTSNFFSGKIFFNTGGINTHQAMVEGINRYNELDINVSFTFNAQSPFDPGAISIEGFYDASTDVLGYVTTDPSGNPIPPVWINTYYFNDTNNRADTKWVIAHELGHLMGFRHTDYFSNCNGSESGTNANHVPNTPTGTSTNSWMNACSGGVDRPFTPQDVEALTRIFGNPKVTTGATWFDGPYNFSDYAFEYGDVTGDGKTDVVAFNVSTERAVVWVSNSTGSGFVASAQWVDGPYNYTGYTFKLGDVTGDGKADMIGFNPSAERAIVWTSNGSGFSSGAQWVDGPYVFNGYLTNVADVTGDGKADLIGFSASAERAIVWTSNGSSFNSGAQWIDGPHSYNAYTFTTSDVTGDGKADLIGVDASNERVVVWNSTGSAFSSGAQWIDGPHNYPSYIFRTGDVTGDGKSDLVGFDVATERAVVWTSTGSAFASSKQWLGGPFVYNGYSFGLGKFNADAKADMIAVNPTTERFIVWRTN